MPASDIEEVLKLSGSSSNQLKKSDVHWVVRHGAHPTGSVPRSKQQRLASLSPGGGGSSVALVGGDISNVEKSWATWGVPEEWEFTELRSFLQQQLVLGHRHSL